MRVFALSDNSFAASTVFVSSATGYNNTIALLQTQKGSLVKSDIEGYNYKLTVTRFRTSGFTPYVGVTTQEGSSSVPTIWYAKQVDDSTMYVYQFLNNTINKNDNVYKLK